MKKKKAAPSSPTAKELAKHQKLVVEIEQRAVPWRVEQIKGHLFKIHAMMHKIDAAFDIAGTHLELLDAYADERLASRKGKK